MDGVPAELERKFTLRNISQRLNKLQWQLLLGNRDSRDFAGLSAGAVIG